MKELIIETDKRMISVDLELVRYKNDLKVNLIDWLGVSEEEFDQMSPMLNSRIIDYSGRSYPIRLDSFFE